MKVSLRLCLASVGNYDYLVSFYSHSSICCLRGKNALLWGVLKQQMVSIHYRTLTSSCNQLDHTVGKLHEKVSYYNIASEASYVYFHHCRFPNNISVAPVCYLSKLCSSLRSQCCKMRHFWMIFKHCVQVGRTNFNLFLWAFLRFEIMMCVRGGRSSCLLLFLCSSNMYDQMVGMQSVLWQSKVNLIFIVMTFLLWADVSTASYCSSRKSWMPIHRAQAHKHVFFKPLFRIITLLCVLQAI